MLSFPSTVRIYLAPGATDMRKQFDGLMGLVRPVLGEDPLSGHLFGFCNRRRDLVKFLLWNHGGFWMYCRRLETGTFDWPREGASRVEMTSHELTALLEGLDMSSARWQRRFELRRQRMHA